MTCLGVKNQFILQQESVNTTGVSDIRQQEKRKNRSDSFFCLYFDMPNYRRCCHYLYTIF